MVRLMIGMNSEAHPGPPPHPGDLLNSLAGGGGRDGRLKEIRDATAIMRQRDPSPARSIKARRVLSAIALEALISIADDPAVDAELRVRAAAMALQNM